MPNSYGEISLSFKKLAMPSKATKEQAPIPNPEATSIDNYM